MMMRRILFLFLAVCLPLSCVEVEQRWDGPVIELTLQTGEIRTRAGADGTREGEDRYNENLMSWVELFFYPGDRTSEDAVYYKYVESGKRFSDVLRLELTYTQVNELLFPQTESIRNCKVFAVVNYPGRVLSAVDAAGGNLSGTSLPELESRLVTTDFLGGNFINSYLQPRFLMTGKTDLALRDRNQAVAAVGIVDLDRLACKLTVGVDVVEEVQIGSETWMPMLDGMQVYLVNGVKNVLLSGEMPSSENSEEKPVFISYRNRPRPFAYKDSEGNDQFYFDEVDGYYQTYPTYTYPQKWTYGSTDTEDACDAEPYLKLVLPWAKVDASGHSTGQRQFYYKIMVPEDTREGYEHSFVRNNWYHIDIHVGILGSETDDARVPIEGCCYIVYWQDRETVVKEAAIGNARYLSVVRDTTELYNISSPVDIHYTSSHPVILKDIRVTRLYYGEQTSGKALGGTIRRAVDGDPYPAGTYYLEFNEDQRKKINGGKEWFTPSDDNKFVTFQHTLNNRYESTTFDYSPFTVSCTIVHSDLEDVPGTVYQKKITVIQRPAIYIDRLTNSDSDQVGGTTQYRSGRNQYFLKSTYWGYVFVDGGAFWPNNTDPALDDHQKVEESNGCIWVPGVRQWRRGYLPSNTNSADMFFKLGPAGEDKNNPDPDATALRREYQWRTVWYTGGSLDLYQMHVTVLPDDSEFIIGDPRTLETVDLGYKFHSPNEEIMPSRDSFAHAPAIYSEPQDLDNLGHRTLSYYYPTENSDRTRNMLAPSYRVSSKFSGVEFSGATSSYYNLGDLQKEYAEYRCATFQEDGFPAGRWRLPTMGEVSFAAQLSANGIFVVLFNPGDKYWSANGVVKIGDDGLVTEVTGTSATTALLRCVYDTWYWGETQEEYDNWRKDAQNRASGLSDWNGEAATLRNQFVWGDRPR